MRLHERFEQLDSFAPPYQRAASLGQGRGHALTRLAAALASVARLLTACVEDFGGEFTIVNQTDEPLFLVNSRLTPHGGSRVLAIHGCGEPGVYVRDKEAGVFVKLDQEYCAGQTWTILGPDHYNLEPQSPAAMEHAHG